MSFKSRINCLCEAINPSGLFGGATMEDISRQILTRRDAAFDEAEPGVQRAAAYCWLTAILRSLTTPDHPRAAEALDHLGLSIIDPDQITVRLTELGVEFGFTDDEMDQLRRMIVARWRAAERATIA
jgi:hypothetical protein